MTFTLLFPWLPHFKILISVENSKVNVSLICIKFRIINPRLICGVCPGGHSQPIRDEAAQEQHLRGVVPANHVPEEAGHPEGAAVDRV